ncbi:MAG: S8 family serine peptidase, partial [Acidobacteria bacterium]|nr:S8 family serine peptidase [Acidobacteriota bacterium]
MRFNSLPNLPRAFSLKRLTALLSLLLIVGLLTAAPASMQSRSTQTQSAIAVVLNNEPYVPGQVVVQLNPGYDMSTVASMYGLDPVPLGQLTLGVPPDPVVIEYLLRITDNSTVEAKVAALSADTVRVAFAEPNHNGGAPEAARPTWSVGDSFANIMAGRKAANTQWARTKIRVDEAQQVTRGAVAAGVLSPEPRPIVVAVLDTGIDLNHPAFAGRLVAPSDMYDFVGNDPDPSEEGSAEIGPYGHGTHVAGLIAMVAPDAKIMPLRVLGADGKGDFFRLAEAIKFALAHGANVINLSLST